VAQICILVYFRLYRRKGAMTQSLIEKFDRDFDGRFVFTPQEEKIIKIIKLRRKV